jgi:hypothetical protein
VFGGPSGDPIESGCPTAGDVSSAIGVLWTPVAGTCTATLVGASAVVTAAHCVADAASAGDPIIAVFGARQFIAGAVELHPAWTPGAPIDDVAALVLTRDVEGIEPLSVDGATPAFGDEFTLIGHGEWSPDEVRDAERQAEPGAVSDLQGETFSYEDPIDEGCLEGRGGGWVVDASSGDLIGIHGEGRRIMRADQYACWLACGASPAALPSGCDCTRSDSRPCGDCGAEYLDWSTHVWSACEAAEELRPCEPGLTCDPAGACVP